MTRRKRRRQLPRPLASACARLAWAYARVAYQRELDRVRARAVMLVQAGVDPATVAALLADELQAEKAPPDPCPLVYP